VACESSQASCQKEQAAGVKIRAVWHANPHRQAAAAAAVCSGALQGRGLRMLLMQMMWGAQMVWCGDAHDAEDLRVQVTWHVCEDANKPAHAALGEPQARRQLWWASLGKRKCTAWRCKWSFFARGKIMDWLNKIAPIPHCKYPANKPLQRLSYRLLNQSLGWSNVFVNIAHLVMLLPAAAMHLNLQPKLGKTSPAKVVSWEHAAKERAYASTAGRLRQQEGRAHGRHRAMGRCIMSHGP